MSERDTQPGELPRVSRIVDVRIPLWGLLCALSGASFFIVGTWFTANQTAKDVSELQITVKAGNQQVTTLAGEQALLRFRMENIEGEMRSIRAQIPSATGSPPTPPPSSPTRR
jgi:hypothetical protein